MCLRNLFCGNDCTWILFIIIVLLLIDNDDCRLRRKLRQLWLRLLISNRKRLVRFSVPGAFYC